MMIFFKVLLLFMDKRLNHLFHLINHAANFCVNIALPLLKIPRSTTNFIYHMTIQLKRTWLHAWMHVYDALSSAKVYSMR